MQCSKSCYVYDLELVDLFKNAVIEQVYYFFEVPQNQVYRHQGRTLPWIHKT